MSCKQKNEDKTIDRKQIPVLPCKEIELIGKDPMKRKIMKETINFFLSTHCFINNRGIISLHVSADRESNEVWTMYSDIEDWHLRRYDVTPLFEVFDGDIVLIFGINHEAENKKRTKEERQRMRTCIDQVIGNRVYQRPTRKDRWTSEYLGPNIDNPQGINRGSTGTSCKRRVVFYDDGTYKSFTTGFQ